MHICIASIYGIPGQSQYLAFEESLHKSTSLDTWIGNLDWMLATLHNAFELDALLTPLGAVQDRADVRRVH